MFRDLGHENADIEQVKAILAAEIIKTLDREGLSVRSAQGRTGVAAADFSRIRNADLGRFTVDRLMAIIIRLGSRVEVKVKVRHAETAGRVLSAYPPDGMKKRPLPAFKSEEEERRFWAKADSTRYVDWSSGKRAKLRGLNQSSRPVSLRPRPSRSR